MGTLGDTTHDRFVRDVQALRAAVLVDGTVYVGSVVDTHPHVLKALGFRPTSFVAGFVDPDDYFYGRTEAALWVKAVWYDLWKLLEDKTSLESIDYSLAAGLPKKGLSLPGVGAAPTWATCVEVKTTTLKEVALR